MRRARLSMKDTEIRLAIIGLGYVGLPLAVAFGRQMPVVGFDTNHRRIEDLRAGRDRTLEVASEDLHGATQLKYSANATDLRDCNVFIVTVPTPVDSANRPDLSHLLSASET